MRPETVSILPFVEGIVASTELAGAWHRSLFTDVHVLTANPRFAAANPCSRPTCSFSNCKAVLDDDPKTRGWPIAFFFAGLNDAFSRQAQM
jgi:hypothetical protein